MEDACARHRTKYAHGWRVVYQLGNRNAVGRNYEICFARWNCRLPRAARHNFASRLADDEIRPRYCISSELELPYRYGSKSLLGYDDQVRPRLCLQYSCPILNCVECQNFDLGFAMNEVSLDQLQAAIAQPNQLPGNGSRLKICDKPDPFVSPTLRVKESHAEEPFSVEVIFVEASAAVGKSVTAQYLSSARNVPLLNLAEVPVSTHSLVGLIQADFPNAAEAVPDFHAGRLPLIIDALDEGRLLSREQAFEGFLETTGELLLRDRTVTSFPKLVFFGRHESTDLAQLGLQVACPGISISKLEVGFFGEESAWRLIDAYARAASGSQTSYLNDAPVRDLIDAYFSAIEAALGLVRGSLWRDKRGKAFAGYAPVLAALGSLLSEIGNPINVTNRLRTTGSQEAWGVIETVFDAVLARERNKLCEKLAPHLSVPVPDQAYDTVEQLTQLARHVHDQPLTESGRLSLSGPDHATYISMVEQYIPEHPFVRQRKVANTVLGSVILSHAVSHDLLANVDLSLLESLSRQPFLWRSLKRELVGDDLLIDGRYLGCVLNSYWNDPATQNPRVKIRPVRDGESATTRIGVGTQAEILVEVTSPISLYGQVRDCDIDVPNGIVLFGHKPRETASSTFFVHGITTIVCDAIEVVADAITMDGKVWFEANRVTSHPRLNLYLKDRTEVGWEGQFSERPPWKQFPSTLSAPYPPQDEHPLLKLMDECRSRLPTGTALVLNENFSVPELDARTQMRWAVRNYSTKFSEVIRLMVQHGIASSEYIEASGSDRKMRVRFNTNWEDLCNEFHRPSENSIRLQRFLAEARIVFE